MSETLHLEGDLYIETFTNNVSNGVIGPVDVNSLEVKPDSEKISIPSKRKGKLGQARETYFVPKPALSPSRPARSSRSCPPIRNGCHSVKLTSRQPA